jgi:hypothetical protein
MRRHAPTYRKDTNQHSTHRRLLSFKATQRRREELTKQTEDATEVTRRINRKEPHEISTDKEKHWNCVIIRMWKKAIRWNLLGHAVAQWFRNCATNRKVAGSTPDGVIGISH